MNAVAEKQMPRTNFGKSRTHDNPYAIYSDNRGWEWRVLKTYKHSSVEKNDGFARWYVSATSPLMHEGSYEYGDTYCRDIKDNFLVKLVSADKEWVEEYGETNGPA